MLWVVSQLPPHCSMSRVANPMNEITNTESLHKLDERHEELLEKLDTLCRELEEALKNLAPSSDSLREAA